LAIALARPSYLFSTGPFGSVETPVAAVMVFDTAARMEYRSENQTQLKKAKERAVRLLHQLPEGSKVAVLDSGSGQGAFQVDRAAAEDRIERLSMVSASLPVAEVASGGVRLAIESDLPRKEVYIFSDLARAAWTDGAIESLKNEASKSPDLRLMLVNVGTDDIQNFSLASVRLDMRELTESSTATVRTELRREGPAGFQTVELLLADDDGKWITRGQQKVELPENGSAEVVFRFGGLKRGTIDGKIRLRSADALECDNVRYFSLKVSDRWPILLVAPGTEHTYARFLAEMLAPDEWRKSGQSPFICDQIKPGRLAAEGKTFLQNYAAVCLVDPPPLTAGTWKKLAEYVDGGGGLAIFMGRNAKPIDSFNSKAAGLIMPAKLVRQARAGDRPFWLNPTNLSHPILAPFRNLTDAVPWSDLSVFRYWELGSTTPGATVIVSFDDARPALIQRTVGQGRVLLMTTPISDLADRKPWNLIPIVDPWPGLILMNQSIRYLVGAAESRYNYEAGQTAIVPLELADRPVVSRPKTYQLTMPDGTRVPVNADTSRHDILISSTDQIGTYHLAGGGKAKGIEAAFSVNLAKNQTELARIGPKELVESLAPVECRIAQTDRQIEQNVRLGRVGRELFDVLILVVALLFGIEHFLANRFYKQ
jgi:hypothetical protein